MSARSYNNGEKALEGAFSLFPNFDLLSIIPHSYGQLSQKIGSLNKFLIDFHFADNKQFKTRTNLRILSCIETNFTARHNINSLKNNALNNKSHQWHRFFNILSIISRIVVRYRLNR